MLALSDISVIAQAEWPNLRARDLARTDVPLARADDSVAHVAALIRKHDTGAVAVIQNDQVAGVVTVRDIGNIERLLDNLDPESGS
jgi:CBS domain-containing protein